MNTLVGPLPRHLYVWVDSTYTHRQPCGWVPAVWFGLVSYPGRVWGCTVMLEAGSIYRNLPPTAIAFDPDPEPDWSLPQAQTWDETPSTHMMRSVDTSDATLNRSWLQLNCQVANFPLVAQS